MSKESFTWSNDVVFAANGSIRVEKFDGRDHIVAPVRMMVAGVHQGLGLPPLRHVAEELEKSVPLWNGVPVVIGHPLDDEMTPISANAAKILEDIGTGRIFNTKFGENGLSAEVWADIEKLKKVSPQALEGLRAMTLEVSIGSWFGIDEEPGTVNGQPFDGTVHSYRPDHLALLPGEVGACSREKGCGIRANASGVCPGDCDQRVPVGKPEGPENTGINPNSGAIVKAFESLKSLICKCGGGCHDKEPEKNIHHNSEGKKMETVDKALVDALVADAGNKWTEAERPFLACLSQEQFDQVKGLEAYQGTKEPEKKEGEVTLEALMAKAPQEIRDTFTDIQRARDEKRASLTAGIKANKQNKFTEDQLKAMSLGILEQVASLATVPAPDYGLQAGHFGTQGQNESAGAPLVTPKWEKRGGKE